MGTSWILPWLLLHPPEINLPLLLILLAAGVATSILLGLALAAYIRRQSRPYLLVALAIAALFARTIVAAVSALNWLPPIHHHLVEHALDIAMVALVIGAVYYARTKNPPTEDPRSDD